MRRIFFLLPIFSLIILYSWTLREGYFSCPLSFFEEAKEVYLQGQGDEGEYLLQRGFFFLFKALQKGEDDLMMVFSTGEDLYLLMQEKGELKELTKGLFQLLLELLGDLQEKKGEENDP